MLDRQDTLTIVALVVSLIALLLASFQMLQTSFLTAEGSRKCKSAIMGKWFIFTRWHFINTELRYEVKFTTPDISLVDMSTMQPTTGTAAELKKLATRKSKTNVFANGFRPRWDHARLAGHVLGWSTLCYNIENMWSRDVQRYQLGHVLRDVDGIRWTPWQTWRYLRDCWRTLFQQDFGDDFSDHSDTVVSWDDFLRLIYCYQRYTIELQGQALNHLLKDSQPPGSPLPVQNASLGTLVVIKLRQHTWDVMPPDVVRPLARSTLGCMIVLARRLGMQWEEIQLRSHNFRAEGPGTSLSSKMVQGLGTVMEFSTGGAPDGEIFKSGSAHQTASTQYADKLIFGIVPGCRELNIADYPLVDDNRNLQLAIFFKQVGSSDAAWQAVQKRYWEGPMIANDLIALLCPFLPSEHSPVTRFPHPIAWKARYMDAQYVSLFHFWEGRGLWLALLRKRMQRPELQNRFNLKKALVALELFRDQFPVEFFSKVRVGMQQHKVWVNQQPPEADQLGIHEPVNEQAQVNDMQHYIEALRKMHDQTTRFFQKMNNSYSNNGDSNSSTQQGSDTGEKELTKKEISEKEYDISACENSQVARINYRGLVRAFINMLALVILDPSVEAGPTIAENDINQPGGAATYLPKMAGIAERVMGSVYGVMKPSALTWLHIENVVAKGVTEADIEEAYWILVVRGICWNMAISWELPAHDKLVPSSLYNSGVPVWIT